MNSRYVALGTLIKIIGGGTPSRREPLFWNGDIPWASVKDLKKSTLHDTKEHITTEGLANSATNVIPAGNIIMATRMALGRCAINAVDMAINQDLKALICGNDIDQGYLFRFLKTQEQYFIDKGKGATVKGLILDQVTSLQVPLPSISDQRRIAAILNRADEIRHKRRQAIDLADRLLRSTFLEMFGDPGTNPFSWPIVTMASIVKETQYGTSEKSSITQSGIPVLRMNNITYDGRWNLKDLKWYDIDGKDMVKYTVSKGDLLFNRTNSPDLVGKTAVWEIEEFYAFAGYLIRIRFKEHALPEYVSCFLNSPFGKRYLAMRAKPAINMSNISASGFLRFELPLPPVALQRVFRDRYYMIRKFRDKQSDAEPRSDQLYKSLQSRCFSGEV